MILNINGDIWQIETVQDLRKNNGTQALGLCDNYSRKIYILDTLPCYKKKEVLRHELLHAILYSYNIYLDPELEEFLAD